MVSILVAASVAVASSSGWPAFDNPKSPVVEGPGIWLGLSLGIGKPTATASAHVTAAIDRHFVTVRAMRSAELVLFIVPGEWLQEYALLYGQAFDTPYCRLRFSGGVGWAEGVARGPLRYTDSGFIFSTRYHDRIEFTALTAAAEIRAELTTRHFGIGAAFLVDVNPRVPVIAFVVTFDFGALPVRDQEW